MMYVELDVRKIVIIWRCYSSWIIRGEQQSGIFFLYLIFDIWLKIIEFVKVLVFSYEIEVEVVFVGYNFVLLMLYQYVEFFVIFLVKNFIDIC